MTTSSSSSRRALAALAILGALVAGCGPSGDSPVSLDNNRDTKGKPAAPARDEAPSVVARGELPTEPAGRAMRRACRRYVPGSADPVRCLTLLPQAAIEPSLQGGRDYEQPEGAFLFGLRLPGNAAGKVSLALFGGRLGGLPLSESGGKWPAEADAGDVGDVLNIVGYGPLDPGDVNARPGPNARPPARGRTTVDGRPAILVTWREQPFAGTVHATNDGIIFNRGGTGWLVSLRFAPDVDRPARVSLLKRVAASLRALDREQGGGTT